MSVVNKDFVNDAFDPRKDKRTRELGIQRSIKDVVSERQRIAELEGRRILPRDLVIVPLHDGVLPSYVGDHR